MARAIFDVSAEFLAELLKLPPDTSIEACTSRIENGRIVVAVSASVPELTEDGYYDPYCTHTRESYTWTWGEVRSWLAR